MPIRLNHLFARGPEAIEAEKGFIREIPLQELGLTLFYILLAAFWLVFSGDIVDWIMGIEITGIPREAKPRPDPSLFRRN